MRRRTYNYNPPIPPDPPEEVPDKPVNGPVNRNEPIYGFGFLIDESNIPNGLTGIHLYFDCQRSNGDTYGWEIEENYNSTTNEPFYWFCNEKQIAFQMAVLNINLSYGIISSDKNGHIIMLPETVTYQGPYTWDTKYNIQPHVIGVRI